jgi:UDP-glucuronate 4-epimerase
MSPKDLRFAHKTYLVTGGAGFIGSHLVRHLLDRDARRVIVVDEYNDFYDPAIKEANLAPLLAGPAGQDGRLVVHRVDIRNAAALAEVFQQAIDQDGDAFREGGIIHLAARAGVRPSLKEPLLYLETNVTGTLHLAELARQHNINKFVFASSSSVYGDSPETVPFHEEQDISRPISPYASTKAMGESLLHTYSHLHGLNVVCLRFFTVYGAAQRPDLAIHKFTKLIDEGKPIPVYGDGSARRDFTYIDDIMQGVLAAIAYNKTPYEIFNLGESETTTVSNLITLIEQALGKEAVIDPYPPQPGDVSVTYADIAKAQELLDYRPTTPLEEGIPKFVAWYQAHKEAQAKAAERTLQGSRS